ncbi:hypothetical protein J4N42_19305 [Vibrio sp. SCSIO 43135]|uniref:ABC transporter substrate-binding protein n=1 Tax=Vibrio sp. SCSIO 43135 TaxID=2819096 RepID=UPI002075E192|nr:ABC transporter substrate binding protein [Vibrio sp. SCSIO 43135]USD42769.1 hypothetical protein J4N42_19305 [Vibrio sp. SCSIO 43135]
MKVLLFLCIWSVNSFAATVLLIESYHSEYAWDKSYVRGIESQLTDDIELVKFQMDTKRIPKSEYQLSANRAYQTYQDIAPQVVILGDDNALSYMLPKLYDEPISIVFLGINSNPRKLLAKYQGQAKVTGILEQPLFVKTMGEIETMLPEGRKKIRVMFDSGVTSTIAQRYMEGQYQTLSQSIGMEAEILTIETQAQWHDKVLSANQDGVGAIVIGLYHTIVDRNGDNVTADTIVSWTNKHSQVPLFGFWDFSVGKGKAAGGVVLFGESQGESAGKAVTAIVAGKSASEIPIRVGQKGQAIYHPQEMARWGLTPPDSWQAIE